MKKIHHLICLTLMAISPITTSCNNSSDSKDYYDYNWVPGENALVAAQPEIKNPVGKCTEINELRRSQNKIGLPSQGTANILVVPVCFQDDDVIQDSNKDIDITIDESDIERINDTYFNLKSKFGYPSVSLYYKKSSFEKLNLSGVVSPLIQLPKEYSEYLLQASALGTSSVHNEILNYVYDYLFNETQTYYLGDFDSDNDGLVDAISIVGNYPYELQFSTDEYTYYHQLFNGPNNVYFQDTIEDSTLVNSFSYISSSFMDGYYLGHDSRMYISLIGSMIGLDTYQDLTGNSSTGMYRAPVGYLDPMSGSLGDHNPFSKYQLGWISPKFIKKEDIPNEGLEITINNDNSGDAIMLYCGEKSLFGEYLFIDLYTPTWVNLLDSVNKSSFGTQTFNQPYIRVFQVDSRLVRSNHNIYTVYEGEPNFDEQLVLPNGEKSHYIYDYAYTNNSINEYASYGLKNYPLVSLLSKKGMNRHLTNSNEKLTIDDMFLTGDKFGSEDQIDGFYNNFTFHNNDELGIEFEVKNINDTEATIVFRRAQ